MIHIALDLDNTITASRESIEFFEILTHLLIPDPEYRIVILTNRVPNSEQEVAEELEYLGIEYSEIVITNQKALYIRDNKITIYFENEDFSFSAEKWIGDKKITKVANG